MVNNQKNQFKDQMPKPGGWRMFIIVLIVSGFFSHILPYLLKIYVPNLYKTIDNIGYTNILFYALELWLILCLLYFLFELIFFYLFTYDIFKLPNNENKRVPKLLMNFLMTQERYSELHRDKHLNVVKIHLSFITLASFAILIVYFLMT